LYRTRSLIGVILLFAAGLGGGWLGCGPDPEETATTRSSTANAIPGLRFAGVSLVYALRRIAAEADMLLALDEIQSGPTAVDLARYRIDFDLEPGPATAALNRLKQHTKTFDYLVFDNVIYVRSRLAVDAVTALDTKDLAATKLTVDLEELVKWIMRTQPRSYLVVRRKSGEPIFRKVDLDIPENSSVLDVLLMYAKAVDRGWRIRRAGQRITDGQGRPGIVASSVALWPPLKEPDPFPRARRKNSITAALASVERRTGTPICIKDRTVLGDILGSLGRHRKNDPGWPVQESVEVLAWAGVRSSLGDYEWEWQDGIMKITSQHYLYFLPGRDLVRDTVTGGVFEGNLAELARWINQNRSTPPGKVLMGGEITGEEPRARLEIAEGSSVETVLTDFARASGAGWNLTIVDALTPDESAKPLPENAWRGAHLTPLKAWLP
jgi:hypothetical protein